MNVSATLDSGRAQRAVATLVLCFLAAVIEGFDLQSMGIAAPSLGPEFRLTRQQLGVVLLASPLGLFFGAFIGGRIADSWGRKAALVLATALFGAFQLGTAWATGLEGLILIRFLCGLGLGGAFPNLIALTAEASGGRNSIINVVITVAGMPAGGALASLVGFLAGANGDWRIVFYVGGFAPLVLAPVMGLVLPESTLFRAAKAAAAAAGTKQTIREVLFGGTRGKPTVLLWVALFFTTLVTYLLLNWMPVLMGSKGFSRTDAMLIQILFNVGGAMGSVYLGWRMQQRPRRRVLLLCYAGLAAGLVVLAPLGKDLLLAAATAAAVGAFVLGAQLILYGLAPAYYATETRGTGTGACVAASRLGSAVGPFLAGVLLGQGASETHVLQALLPVTAVAAAAAMGLLFLKREELRAVREPQP
ncbi:MAG TPA: 3-(3-hydroxy-phenyl)propionate transporter MhpT [Steroidobacteraceae bacterium]